MNRAAPCHPAGAASCRVCGFVAAFACPCGEPADECEHCHAHHALPSACAVGWAPSLARAVEAVELEAGRLLALDEIEAVAALRVTALLEARS